MDYSITFQMYCLLVFLVFCLFFSCCIFLAYPQLSKASTLGDDNFLSWIIFIGVQTRCVNCCTRTGARIVISIYVNAR